jgi:hypothetical protein
VLFAARSLLTLLYLRQATRVAFKVKVKVKVNGKVKKRKDKQGIGEL